MEKRPEFILFGNGSYLNCGCEALFHGTFMALERAFPACGVTALGCDFSRAQDARREESTDRIRHLPRPVPRRGSREWAAKRFLLAFRPEAYWPRLFTPLDGTAATCRAALAIGGDNYGLEYGYPAFHLAANRYFRRRGVPLVLWGASVGPFTGHPREEAILRNLRESFDVVFAREERTREYLREKGYRKKIFLMPDPAFLLEPRECGEAELGFGIPRGALGVNFSPLLARFMGKADRSRWPQTCARIVDALYRRYGLPILLVPHSTPSWDDDYGLLARVRELLGGKVPGLYLVPPGLSAAQLKWVISRCRCFLGARTHSTIAAFSSAVPVYSLAYSAKAWGINRMLYGHTDYVMDCRRIDVPRLVEGVGELLDRESRIVRRFRRVVPGLKRDVYRAADDLRGFLGRSEKPRGAAHAA